MSNQKMYAFGALAALAAATMLTQSSAHAAGQAGMVVVRDPQTGELRAPTAAEANALVGRAQLQRKAPFQPVEAVGPGGSRKVQLGKSKLAYTVVTRQADGTLAEQCVTGASAAQSALSHPAPATESPHETE